MHVRTRNSRPGRPYADPYQTSNSQIYLKWAAPVDNGSPIIDYIVERSADGGRSWIDLTATQSLYTNTYWLDMATITAEKSYQYRVYAVNSVQTPVGTVFYSPEATLVAAAVPATPRVCSSSSILPIGCDPGKCSCELAAIASTETTITVAWAQPESAVPITGFRLYANGALLYDGSGNIGSLSYVYAGCETGNIFDFQLEAISTAGVSLRSAQLSRVCARRPYSPAPPGLYSASRQSVTLQWKPPADNGGAPITGYLVQRSRADANDYGTVDCL